MDGMTPQSPLEPGTIPNGPISAAGRSKRHPVAKKENQKTELYPDGERYSFYKQGQRELGFLEMKDRAGVCA